MACLHRWAGGGCTSIRYMHLQWTCTTIRRGFRSIKNRGPHSAHEANDPHVVLGSAPGAGPPHVHPDGGPRPGGPPHGASPRIPNPPQPYSYRARDPGRSCSNISSPFSPTPAHPKIGLFNQVRGETYTSGQTGMYTPFRRLILHLT